MDATAVMTAFANSAGGHVMSGLGQQAHYYMGNVTGYNQSLRDDQAKQEERLTGIQLAANKEQMAYNQELSKDMYEYTGYASKVRQMKEAGLNPALMYAGGGAGGGVTGNVSGGAGKGNASDEMSRRMADIQSMGMALQNSKLKSEVDLMKAQADNLNAETDKMKGVDTEEAKTRISNILADIGNKKLLGAGMQLQNDYDAIRNDIASITKDSDVKFKQFESLNAQLLSSKLVEETKILETQGKVAKGTADALINKANAEVNNLFMDAMLKGAQIRGIDTGIEKIRAEIEQIQANIDVLVRTNEFKEADIQVRKDMIKGVITSSWIQFGGNALNGLMDIGSMFIPGGSAAKALKEVPPAKVGF